MFGELFPPITQHITLTCSHNTKYWQNRCWHSTIWCLYNRNTTKGVQINESRSTTFVRFVVAMDIPLIGRTASRILDRHFHGNLRELELAALDRFDFTCLEGIGNTMSGNIHEWFRNSDHLLLWRNLQKELHFENGLDADASGEENNVNGTNNKFAGCTIAATGKPRTSPVTASTPRSSASAPGYWPDRSFWRCCPNRICYNCTMMKI